jgi:cytochrome c oxidase subunit 1
MVYVLLDSLRNGKKATGNPWGGASLEWQSASPPLTENFSQTPVVRDPYDYSGIAVESES